MTKNKNTKRALLGSVLSMIVCLAMLIGSTFAWFTDSVVSGTNKIVAGNLDVELVHTNANVTTEETVKDATDLFVKKDGTQIKWEPGVMVYENFTVKNKGNLALKYRLQLTKGANNTVNGHSLNEVLKVAYVENHFSGDRTVAKNLEFKPITEAFEKVDTLEEGGSKEYAMVVYWEPTDHDNDFNVNNGATVTNPDGSTETGLFIDLGVNLEATQHTVENDSFGNDYDRLAALELEGYEKVGNVEQLNTALQAGKNVILTDNITTTSINAPEGTVIEGNGKTITGNGNLSLSENVEYKDINFKVSNGGWGVIVSAAKFTDCTFDEASPYLVPKEGEDIIVEGCKFINTPLQICYNEGDQKPQSSKTIIKNNDFVVNNTDTGAHAIVLGGGSPEFWASNPENVTMSGNKFTPKNPDISYIAYYIYGDYGTTLTSIPTYNDNIFNGEVYSAINSTDQSNQTRLNP